MSDWSELAAAASREIDASPGSVADGWSPAAREAVTRLTEAIVAEGVERTVAEAAVTRWAITKRPIEECVRVEVESRNTGPTSTDPTIT